MEWLEKRGEIEARDFMYLAADSTLQRVITLGGAYKLVDGDYDVKLRLSLTITLEEPTKNSILYSTYISTDAYHMKVHTCISLV
jgi:hypothetical protein